MENSDKAISFSYYNNRRIDKGTAWILFLLLGWSYGSMGSMLKQIFFYLTLGGLGIWAIYRLFTLNGAIKRYNRAIALEVGLDNNDLLKLGLI